MKDGQKDLARYLLKTMDDKVSRVEFSLQNIDCRKRKGNVEFNADVVTTVYLKDGSEFELDRNRPGFSCINGEFAITSDVPFKVFTIS